MPYRPYSFVTFEQEITFTPDEADQLVMTWKERFERGEPFDQVTVWRAKLYAFIGRFDHNVRQRGSHVADGKYYVTLRVADDFLDEIFARYPSAELSDTCAHVYGPAVKDPTWGECFTKLERLLAWPSYN